MPNPPLSLTERSSIRHHMGYINVSDVWTFLLGSPAALETTFVIEGAMNVILDEALPRVRKILSVLEAMEQQNEDDLELLAVSSLGDIDVNPKELRMLEGQYDKWVAKLANVLGVPRNPFDKRLEAQGGINRTVAG
jgi:hypothetical protein